MAIVSLSGWIASGAATEPVIMISAPPAACNARVLPTASLRNFSRSPGWRSVQRSTVPSRHFVARGLDRPGTHPPPHQHDVLVRSVVEAVPAGAGRIDYIAFH